MAFLSGARSLALPNRLSRYGARIPTARAGVPIPRCLSQSSRAALEIALIPCLKDNYAYLLRDSSSGTVAVVDPSTAQPVIDALEKRGLKKLTYIINTHRHWDHTGGNAELKERYGAQIVAPPGDDIPNIDVPVKKLDVWTLGEHEVEVIETPGHTRGHVCYHFRGSKAVFTGDTLFSIGCGRLFEGTASQSNAMFAIGIEPGNPALKFHLEKVKQLRNDGLPTIPSTVGDEKKFNPFLRTSSQEIRRSLNLPRDALDVDVFAAVRKAKDAA